MKPKYDQIGGGYNEARKADHFLTERLFHHLSPLENGTYLDVGCGTGNYTFSLYQKGVEIAGLDPSLRMLNVAKSKYPELKWIEGRVESIPVNSESIDGVICSLTVHHWNDLNNAFEEINRVLKPQGRLVIFTSTPEQMKGYWLCHYFPKMLQDSMIQMPSFKAISSVFADVGFSNIDVESYDVKPDLQDSFLYAGKENPTLYLDTKLRNGISSFSSLANAAEVKAGLEKLESDIASGVITEVRKQYSNHLGDYLFIIAKKTKQ